MLRTLAKLFLYFVGAHVLVLLLVVGVMIYLMSPTSDEVGKAMSPDGRVTATLLETNGGATTSFGYVVHLAPTGDQKRAHAVASLYGARRSPSAYGVNLRWQSDRELVVEFMNAGTAELFTPSLLVGGRAVSTVLRPGVTDPSAPAGGMLYNRNKQAGAP